MNVVLLGGLGTTRAVWHGQRFGRALELPGHGRAPVPAGAVSVESIGRRVLDGVTGRFSFCGVSLGGMVGMWLGANAPERIERLVLACTGARLGTPEAYRQRATLVRSEGVDAVVEDARERWFTAGFRRSARAAEALEAMRSVPAEAYAACCEAVGEFDFRGRLADIAPPTLVIFGRDDPVTTEAVRAGLDRFECVDVPGAHLAHVEFPDQFNDVAGRFLGV